jgi:hypothetical protein
MCTNHRQRFMRLDAGPNRYGKARPGYAMLYKDEVFRSADYIVHHSASNEAMPTCSYGVPPCYAQDLAPRNLPLIVL